MKFVKYLVVLSFVLCAFANNSNAQANVAFLATGSSALFNELGQAAFNLGGGTATGCLWTASGNAALALVTDNRSGVVTETGSMWVAWTTGGGSGTCAAPAGAYNIYAMMSLDSVIGDRCYFEVDTGVGGLNAGPGCILTFTPGSTAGANKICYPQPVGSCTSFLDNSTIPSAVATALNGKHVFVAATDIRPEDAKFASLRMFTTCGTPVFRQPFDQGLRQVYGLGYQTSTTGVGTTISSFYGGSFHVLDFNITGNDPINTTQSVPAYTVTTVGAQPIIVVVHGPNIMAASEINGFTLSQFLEGVAGRTTDLAGPTVTAAVTTLVREPLSGTYNTMEFSIPNSSQFHVSQDDFNCSGTGVASNPMHLQSTNGVLIGGNPAVRNRVIGTSQMVSTLQGATTDTIGYFFWSQGNASAFTAANGKYLTVNGVDPLQSYPYAFGGTNQCTLTGQGPNTYDGIIPGADAAHQVCNVSFKSVNSGDYPVWSALRLVSQSPTPAGVTALVAAAQTLNSTAHDFITLANLNVWHSHFSLPAINVNVQANGPTINPLTAGDLCATGGALAESGGDVGGANVPKQMNLDFCSDFASVTGLINKVN
jgi:hypothetical protein